MQLEQYLDALKPFPMLPCLSVRQPYATALLEQTKTIEIRNSRIIVKNLRCGGIIGLHSGGTWYGQEGNTPKKALEIQIRHEPTFERLNLPSSLIAPERYFLGGIIGLARIIDCIEFTAATWENLYPQHRSNARFTPGVFGYVLSDVVKLSQPIPCKGQLGLFGVPVATITKAIQAVS